MNDMEEILSLARATGGDFAELFFEDREDTALKCTDGSIGSVTSLHIKGVGLYVLQGTKSVYVYGNDTSYPALKDLAQSAAQMLSDSPAEIPEIILPSVSRRFSAPYRTVIDPRCVETKRKAAAAGEMYLAAMSAGPKVLSLRTEFYDYVQHITVVNSEGLWAEDDRAAQRVRLAGTVGWQDQNYYTFHDYNRPGGFEAFEGEDHLRFAKNTILRMEQHMKVKPLPACTMPVVFEAGPCGVFWHEACGHNLESTGFNSSCFAGKEGTRIASEKVTLIDDGTIPGLSGSEAMDDEGHVTQKNVLIENGIMKGWLCDRKGGRVSGLGSTGSGRRQNYTYAPAARMHNTYLAAGEDDEEEMIASIDDGLLVTGMGGGSSGNNFSVLVTDGYHIRGGKICEPVGGMSLSGTSTEIIRRVDRVGRKVVPDLDAGFCGAASGLVQTTAYEPRFRVSEMRVGGAE